MRFETHGQQINTPHELPPCSRTNNTWQRVHGISDFIKNLYSCPSVFGGCITLGKISASIEDGALCIRFPASSQMMHSLLFIKENYTRALCWRWTSSGAVLVLNSGPMLSSCLPWDPHSQNSPVVNPYLK
jgi:hypothetical protein